MRYQQEQAISIVKRVCHSYFTERDTEEVLRHAAPQIVWVANEINQICRGKEELSELLRKEEADFTQPYKIEQEWYEATPLTEDSCIVYGEILLEDRFEDAIIQMNRVRLTAICQLNEQEILLQHVHASAGIGGTQDGQYRPSLMAQKHVNDMLHQLIKKKTSEVELVYEEYREGLARYKFALEMTNDVVFEYDLSSNQILVDDQRFYELFQMKPQRGLYINLKEEMFRQIHPDDRERVGQLFEITNYMGGAQAGNEVISCEYRINNSKDEYIWVLGQMVPIKDQHGRVIKMIGSIKNIDDRVRKEQEMKQLSQKDSLTGLLNRACTQSLITAAMEQAHEGESGAMFIIDIDNFKEINDRLGHLYGDAALSYLAAALTKVFRSTDIIGRVGGDEFLVFLLGSPSIDVIESRAAQICAIFRDAVIEDSQNYKVSGSVGIALYPEQGSTYYDLFQHADDALYQAKKRGKDQYCFY